MSMGYYNMISGAFIGMISGSGADAVTRINNKLARVTAAAENRVRGAENEQKAAIGSLARWTQSLNNQRLLRAGGEAIGAEEVNFRRRDDAGTTAGFQRDLRQAELLGQQAAARAVAGVSGNVVDTINMTTALRHGIGEQVYDDRKDMADYDAQVRKQGIFTQMVGGLDNSLILDTLDYNRSVGRQEAVLGRTANIIRGVAAGAGDGALVEGYSQRSQASQQTFLDYGTGGSGEGLRAQNQTAQFRFNYENSDGTVDYSIASTDRVRLGENSGKSEGWWTQTNYTDWEAPTGDYQTGFQANYSW